ncbi:NADH-quinone oxidoreductase chain E [Neoasaia chiangmaiensis NBRC 101099]|uniref:NADH-quinone oxidoreductase subunit E n=1 Tax=Neoasaia chiangmaiensis TaxID=320497 RepID=A0A1U9KS46_9PROT|nr:NADH-quinone oxidoreductase subunit NuoE [Neoasaia chiangmaiensis]AQS88661.1 NADH dehydrogenase [Neoasaia chiangmaiensis]GBR41118.1 NADH-quinone oxidoreductase chain E [Neoasaia chiangmaiensis NBRC 101099]GEN13604.1 NADH-quinone oxidoreductase subunit E [Neoasaia chiangmaiensis]
MLTAERTASGAEMPDRIADDLVHTITEMGHHDVLPRGACIEALRMVQERYGWICDRHLKQVADILGMSLADIDGVATYFNLLFRKPVGKNVIMLCDSVSCWVMGVDGVREKLCRKLGVSMGQTTQDGEFTLLPIVCLGHCDHAPAMMIGKDLYGPVRPEDIDAIIDERRGAAS